MFFLTSLTVIHKNRVTSRFDDLIPSENIPAVLAFNTVLDRYSEIPWIVETAEVLYYGISQNWPCQVYGRWLLFTKEFPQTHGMRLTCVLQNVYKLVPKSTLDDTHLTDKFTNCRLCRNVKLSTSPFYSSPQVWAYHKCESNFHLKICVLPVISLTLYWTIFRYFTFLRFKQFPLTSSTQISLLLNVFSVTGDCIGLNQPLPHWDFSIPLRGLRSRHGVSLLPRKEYTL